jgi:hypothetical protein
MEKVAKIKREEAKKSKERLKSWEKDLETLPALMKKAQKVFNTFIRNRDAKMGCISCGMPLTQKFDAGHFYNANNHWSVRFSELNVHGQCVHCNRDLHGNLLEYRKRIIHRVGAANLSWLDMEARKTRKFTKDELREIAKEYTEKNKLYRK